jgi:UDP-N-acetylglucosamine--N-acetylmuramyl-(pentapeptide) pyrophosphoryl-undecaprenol N-acetylglucosamine transferase
MKKGTIVLTGGGTAGHVCPHINLSNELNKHFEKIVYIGSKNGIEKTLITSQTQYDYKSISTVKFIRRNLLKNILLPFKLSKAINEAKKIIKETKPSIIFSKGGYVSLPVVIAGHKLKIPIICHESDITMGLANKLASKYATKVCTNFEITTKNNKQKFIHTGSPLPISQLSKSEAKQKLKIKTDKKILLVTGGSLGATTINELIFKNIDELTKKYFVIHLVGKGNLNRKLINKNNYKQIEFSNEMWTIIKASDFAISRAGANTILELLTNQIPTILIPLPKGISRGDQIENAKYLSSIGVSKTIFQEDLSIKKLQNELISLENDANFIRNQIKLQNFEDGTNKLISLILENKKD